jgi:anionic cell wall polymer biosynthesis LytR-Cps2A-Psr (LCP) family protein
MPAQDKPYRVYRGGRAKGRVPLTRHTSSPSHADAAGPATSPRTPRNRAVRRRWIALGLVLLLVLLVAWAVASYLSVASGVSEANDRVPAGVERQLKKRRRAARVDAVDHPRPRDRRRRPRGTGGREPVGLDHAAAHRPGKRRLAYLSIPRDLQVEIPEYGLAKINAANQFGGPALALRTVKDLTGLDVNHVVFVDFDRFEELIDAVGGIDVNVARAIRSNRFDCPYKTARTLRAVAGLALRTRRPPHGRPSRPRLLADPAQPAEPAETDFDRARRQQQVVAATLDKVTSVGTALRLPFVGGDLVRPLATDLTAWELMQLGWVYFRADTGRALHCRSAAIPPPSAASR